MAAPAHVVLLFPGQGSQTPGMAADLAAAYPAARGVLDAVDEALGAPLSRLMADGPADELTRTDNAQPALLAHGAALWAVLRGVDMWDHGAQLRAWLAGLDWAGLADTIKAVPTLVRCTVLFTMEADPLHPYLAKVVHEVVAEKSAGLELGKLRIQTCQDLI